MTASLRFAVIWSHHVGISFCYTVGLIVLPRCVDALVLQEGLSVLVDAILHGLQFTHMLRFRYHLIYAMLHWVVHVEDVEEGRRLVVLVPTPCSRLAAAQY